MRACVSRARECPHLGASGPPPPTPLPEPWCTPPPPETSCQEPWCGPWRALAISLRSGCGFAGPRTPGWGQGLKAGLKAGSGARVRQDPGMGTLAPGRTPPRVNVRGWRTRTRVGVGVGAGAGIRVYGPGSPWQGLLGALGRGLGALGRGLGALGRGSWEPLAGAPRALRRAISAWFVGNSPLGALWEGSGSPLGALWEGPGRGSQGPSEGLF